MTKIITTKKESEKQENIMIISVLGGTTCVKKCLMIITKLSNKSSELTSILASHVGENNDFISNKDLYAPSVKFRV